MEEVGLNLDGQWSKNVKEYIEKKTFDYVITVCAHAEENCPTAFLGTGKHEHWYFEDPAGFKDSDKKMLGKFREVREQIDMKIREWVAEFIIINGKSNIVYK